MHQLPRYVRIIISAVLAFGLSACASTSFGPGRSVLELEKQGTRKIEDRTVELYMTLNVDLSDADKKAFHDSPEKTIRKLLEDQGHKVNEVVIPGQARAAGGNFFISKLKTTCYHHVQIPIRERSRWIIVVVDTPYC